jgi:ParB family transcriptional regulator, chromosome partitioning protein
VITGAASAGRELAGCPVPFGAASAGREPGSGALSFGAAAAVAAAAAAAAAAATTAGATPAGATSRAVQPGTGQAPTPGPAPTAAPAATRPCEPKGLPALQIPVGLIAPDPDHPRRRYSEKRLAALAASVRAAGVLEPLLVTPHPDAAARAATPYQLIHGLRRWTAARRAGLAAVPAVIRERPLSAPDRLMTQIAGGDGALREDLALYDLATAVARAYELARSTQVQFAQRYGRSQAWLAYLLGLARAADAPGPVRDALVEGHLRSILVACTFLRLTPARQRDLLDEARRKQLPIGLRQAERAAGLPNVVRLRTRPVASPAAAHPTPTAAPAAEATAGAAPAWVRLLVRPDAADGREPAATAGPPANDPATAVDMDAGPSAPPPAAPTPDGGQAAAAPAAGTDPSPPAAGCWITIELTLAQLQTLVVRLGKKPSRTPRGLARQLVAGL